ncbi:hypothetical protein [Amycolatopsis sp. NPDC051903]|uniref:hypothetical protein n=1 Tax=Amycolatopsis sp. NPDC051903 TaxID=3363936 RepID=UPI0037B71825
MPRFHALTDLSPASVERRLEESAEAAHNQAHNRRLLIELLAQHVANRRHPLVLAAVAVPGVLASLVCALSSPFR